MANKEVEMVKDKLATGRLLVIESGKSLPPITLRVPMPKVKPPRTPGTISTPDRLPAVAGRQISTSLAEFERKCLVLLEEEQRLPCPNNAIIAVLCESVRLKREYCDVIQVQALPVRD